MNLSVAGIDIDVLKKNIKNMHLQIKPPDGHVVVSVPLSVSDQAIEAFVRIHLSFIKKSIAQFNDQARLTKRQYISGETIYIWGTQYFIEFKTDNIRNKLEIKNRKVLLSMRENSTVKQRDSYVKEYFRKILKSEIEKKIIKWEEITGLKCSSWQIKNMTTKWGTCSVEKKKLWFNLQLVQKPIYCLDYVILHELTHLITKKHDDIFIKHMDKYMPKWREIKKELNSFILESYKEK